MRRWVVAAILATAYGCGSDERPCSGPDERTGTYLVTSETLSGNCGDLDSTIVQVRDGAEEPDPGCTTDYERVSEDQCSVETAVTCEYPADNYVADLVGKLSDGRDGGETLTAIVTITLRYLDAGSLICTGTYDLTYTRQ